MKKYVTCRGQSGGYITPKVFQKQPIDQLLKPRFLQGNKALIGKKNFHLARVDDATKQPPTCDMKKFLLYLQKLNSSDGQPKYTSLVSLFKALLSVSHGKSAPENGFSINKAMFNVHEYFLGESTIEAFKRRGL